MNEFKTIDVDLPAGAQVDEWLNDLAEEVDAVMAQPLRVGDDTHSSFSPFAFCAPEVIRQAVVTHIVKTNLENLP